MASSSSSPEISSADPVQSFSYKDATKEEVLEDLSSRFILNLPDEELSSMERVCFQVEQAHWFYEDFIREQNPDLPPLSLKKFSEMLFHACPLLHQWTHEDAFNHFMQYKTRVPVCGAIMMNDAMDKCVLVKGWKSSAGWGFPKGKINQTEPDKVCAIREVLEETGYNISSLLNEEVYDEVSIQEQRVRLYYIIGVPEDFPFQTKTRKEISKIEWFRLSDLPTWKRNKTASGRFYLIVPFIGKLRTYVNQSRRRNNPRKTAKGRRVQAAPSQMPSISQEAQSQEPPQSSNAQTATVNGTSLSSPLPTTLDPHMSRLLSSLTLSAAALTANPSQSNPDNTTNNDTVSLRPSSDTRASDASADSPVVNRLPEQLDWSSSAPISDSNMQSAGVSNLIEQTPAESSTPSAVSAAILPQSTPNGSLQPIESISPKATQLKAPPSSTMSPSAHPLSSVVPPSLPSSAGQYLPSSAGQPQPSSANQPLPSPTSPTSRRSSSTADISPYLARTTAVPTSAKRLQQLSLLESVANESEKLAPIIAARAAAVSRGPLGTQLPPPPLMHPQTIPGNLRDVGVLYSSVHPPPPASATGFHPRPPHEHLGPGYHDPFQVRARTSQAFHRSPMHNPTGSVSINQNHLLATINNARGGGPGLQMNPQMNSQFMHDQLHSQQFNGAPQFFPPQLNRQFAPSHPFILPGTNVYPNQTMHAPPPPPPGFRPYPNSLSDSNPNPGSMLSMVAPNSHNPTSMSLLSILNGRPSQQPNVPAQVHQ